MSSVSRVAFLIFSIAGLGACAPEEAYGPDCAAGGCEQNSLEDIENATWTYPAGTVTWATCTVKSRSAATCSWNKAEADSEGAVPEVLLQRDGRLGDVLTKDLSAHYVQMPAFEPGTVQEDISVDGVPEGKMALRVRTRSHFKNLQSLYFPLDFPEASAGSPVQKDITVPYDVHRITFTALDDQGIYIKIGNRLTLPDGIKMGIEIADADSESDHFQTINAAEGATVHVAVDAGKPIGLFQEITRSDRDDGYTKPDLSLSTGGCVTITGRNTMEADPECAKTKAFLLGLQVPDTPVDPGEQCLPGNQFQCQQAAAENDDVRWDADSQQCCVSGARECLPGNQFQCKDNSANGAVWTGNDCCAPPQWVCSPGNNFQCSEHEDAGLMAFIGPVDGVDTCCVSDALTCEASDNVAACEGLANDPTGNMSTGSLCCSID